MVIEHIVSMREVREDFERGRSWKFTKHRRKGNSVALGVISGLHGEEEVFWD